MNHCLYCGETLPQDLKEGHAPPEGLKWVERPDIPPDASKTLAMMKAVPSVESGKPRSWIVVAGAVSVPVLAVLVYLVSTLARRVWPGSSGFVLVLGAAAIGYVGWSFWRGVRS
jgi:hypothetical protein